ncbi:MAG: UDP-N-acetylglucosamine 2-epimerase (non-hydrolyzing) [Bacteroidales bacterium]|nr:UDP-N-acetylglucosamine 2-epimerase (non-hydrolyzing) [Bacteroidales bacterium]
MKIVSIIGARPQFVKAAVFNHAVDRTTGVKEVVIHTGQHFDANMSQLFFDQLGMREPRYNLGIHSMEHEEMVAKMCSAIEEILANEKPDWVVVFGDTDSTLAGALAAKECSIRLCHIEAGLRSFNEAMREEYNRKETDCISDLLCCPTELAVMNLTNEGIPNERILVTGDIMKDAALHYRTSAKPPQETLPEVFHLCTLHRAENTDDPDILRQLMTALEHISSTIPVVMPLHPRTRQALAAQGFPFGQTSIRFIEPVGYLEMLYLLQHCRLVLTDSGGLQKEAYFAHKYCLTLREETEWTELLTHGYNHLVGHVTTDIVDIAEKMAIMPPLFTDELYGDGHAAEKIVEALKRC